MKYFSVVLILIATSASAVETDLATVISAAERASNLLTAVEDHEKVTESQVSIAKGDYLPHLEADAVGTWGFPGSSSSLGIGGLVGSPYRSGYGAGLLATATVWDFGRTSSSVRGAEHLSQAQKAETDLTRYDVDMGAVRLFFECVRFRTQMDAWAFVLDQAKVVEKEVDHFVSTGQRSIVERYLSKAQTEEAQTKEADFQQEMKLVQQRLSVLTRLTADKLQCPNFSETSKLGDEAIPPAETNPLMKRASENSLAAQAQVDAARADFMPKLKAFAGVGALENTRVVAKQDYAAGVAISLPLFDGFKTVNSLEGAHALADEKDRLLAAAQDQIDAVNAHYNQIIESAQLKLFHLNNELTLADQGFAVAKKRYFSLEGNLVDLREALRNLMRTRSETIDSQAEYLTAVLQKNIFNGQIKKSF